MEKIKLLFVFFYIFILNSTFIVNSIFLNNASIQLQRLKILFMTDKFPFAPRYYINNQIIGFLNMGHDVYVLAKNISPELGDFSEFGEHYLKIKIFYEKLPISDNSFDVVYAQFGERGNQAVHLILTNQLRTKLLVCCFRGADITKKLKKNPNIYSELFKHADILFPVCINFKNILIENNANKDKVIVHHSGINCEKFTYEERERLKNGIIKIITVARLHRAKGIDNAIKAVAQLYKNGYLVNYTIIGQGSEYQKLQNLIISLGMQKNIFLLGHMLHEDIVRELHQSHIFLLTPITFSDNTLEGIPNAMMEAMATGLPVIGTSNGGISELIIHEKSGLLVKERDIEGLIFALQCLIEDPQLCREMGKCGRSIVVKEHDSKSLNKKAIELFYEYLGMA